MVNVLLVEDDPALTELFSENLGLLGYQVFTAESVEEAIRTCDQIPDQPVIISDINLKGSLKGFQILSLLGKKCPVTPETILMTGGLDISPDTALKLGARKLLRKPFDFLELSTEIQRVVLLRNLSGRVCKALSELSGCRSLGVRLEQGEDYPYFVFQGFNPAFIQHEKVLCALCQDGSVLYDDQGRPFLECMCGSVIRGHIDSSKPFFTEQGSFWTNSTTELLRDTTPEDRGSHTRNFCNKNGYESVALVPIGSPKDGTCLGLLQLNDSRKDMFTIEVIRGAESLASELCNNVLSLLRVGSANSP